jgi:hypothetical protein
MSFSSGKSLTDYDPQHTLAYHGLSAWNGDPYATANNVAITPTTQVSAAKIWCPVSFTAGNLYWFSGVNGATLTAASATTIASGDGQNVNNLTSATLNVAATAGFSAVNPSYIRVATTSPAGTAILKYTGTSGGNAFTGITTISGNGTITTGNAVGQSYNTIALYKTDGTTATQIGFAVDQVTAWTAGAGLQTHALTVVQGQSLAIAGGTYVYAFYGATGTTPPNARAFQPSTPTTMAVNVGVTGANLAFGRAIAAAGGNVLPDQFTLASLNASVTGGATPWFALGV